MTFPAVSPRLGCAQNYYARIFRYDRAATPFGPRLHTSIPRLARVEWERVEADFSEAKIDLFPAQLDSDCCNRLAPRYNAQGQLIASGVEPFMDELALYRDNDRNPIWQGPVWDSNDSDQRGATSTSTTNGMLTINARDIGSYTQKRLLDQDMWYQDPGEDRPIAWGRQDPAVIAQYLIDRAFHNDDPQVRVNTHITPVPGRRVQRTARAGEVVIGAELIDLARAGITFYTVGRSLFIHGDWQPQQGKRYARLTGEDFLGGLRIIYGGSDTATGVSVVGAVRPGTTDTTNTVPEKVYLGGIDPRRGRVESLVRADRITDHNTLNAIGRRALGYGNPPPTTINLDSGATLNPEAPVSIHDLVPARWFLIQAQGSCRSVSQVMRLSHLRVTWDAGAAGAQDVGETVQAAFVPPAVTGEDPDPEV